MIAPRIATVLVAAASIALIAGPATAATKAKVTKEPKRDETVLSRPAGTPVLAIVSLSSQRVSIYDAQGRILRAPVSTGQTGYETPPGIYSVIGKEAEHYSNLYDDASMPFMQRITWSGIALHAGALPGHPASHGCIRMPYAFAERLFGLTKMGMRVLVVGDDVAPVEFAHAALFKPMPIPAELAVAKSAAPDATLVSAPSMRLGGGGLDASPQPITWRAIAAVKAAEADTATKTAGSARALAAKAGAEAARFVKPLRMAEAAKVKAEGQLKQAETALEAAGEGDARTSAEEAKQTAEAKLAEAVAKLETIKSEGQPKIDAAEAAREAVKVAESARIAAVAAAKEAERKTAPVSVFISRKTQKLYVRQAFQPVFESDVVIRDADRPIGSFLFTALDYANDAADVRWNAVSMYPDAIDGPASAGKRGKGNRGAEGAPADTAAAKAALDRIEIPRDAIERVSQLISPGSSLIVSDEGISRETGKGTDFVVLMSGEPQGGITIRKKQPVPLYRPDGPYSRPYGQYGRSPGYGKGVFSWW